MSLLNILTILNFLIFMLNKYIQKLIVFLVNILTANKYKHNEQELHIAKERIKFLEKKLSFKREDWVLTLPESRTKSNY